MDSVPFRKEKLGVKESSHYNQTSTFTFVWCHHTKCFRVLVGELFCLSTNCQNCGPGWSHTSGLCGRPTSVTVYVAHCLTYVGKVTSSWTWSFPAFVPLQQIVKQPRKDLNGRATAWPDKDKRSEVTGSEMSYSFIRPMRRYSYEDGWMKWQALRRATWPPLMPASRPT